ncbi:hypothetical protein LS684_10225 [Cytobacillus spongiae]|uniref:hypothetical protein n=1 Tax=Cytobacillus spongiae TaxID=2901381 RepID=UPI001F462514|nr:hypothetical protein [Cytobacillus spongiae]UII57765.1 hypothetical protein LS684_10225 [Cytobacillus spongiae]
MKDLMAMAILLFFVVGLITAFVFSDGGFKSDSENIKSKTQSMLQSAQDSMDTSGL